MIFDTRASVAGILATILLVSSPSLSAAGELMPPGSGLLAKSVSLEALAPARRQQISQAEYEQFMMCAGRLEAGIAAMKIVRSQQNTTEFDALIASGEEPLLPVTLELMRLLERSDRGFDKAAGASARRAGRDVFDRHVTNAQALAFTVRNVLVLTRECQATLELVSGRI